MEPLVPSILANLDHRWALGSCYLAHAIVEYLLIPNTTAALAGSCSGSCLRVTNSSCSCRPHRLPPTLMLYYVLTAAPEDDGSVIVC